MRKALILLPLLFLALYPIACNRNLNLGPAYPLTPAALPTPTATPNLTPVCGFTTYSLGTISLQAAPGVIAT